MVELPSSYSCLTKASMRSGIRDTSSTVSTVERSKLTERRGMEPRANRRTGAPSNGCLRNGCSRLLGRTTTAQRPSTHRWIPPTAKTVGFLLASLVTFSPFRTGEVNQQISKRAGRKIRRLPRGGCHPRPSASFETAGSPRSLSIESVPTAGPTASGAKAHCHPTRSTNTGTN